ncbi:hypothetical protein K437DRAFT_267668 [Tilletiaria anomala UBC 951]|uniref:RGS domain-containing protein n=1 Tax=Tilletiaria anomala (strain ATCC 24038 / CBS 436.72 / UBC 951) TaxID=1037660 RepID=A0A066WAR5_TILAU|nr:uncharacterized protein K437DRAFT_267668 [Tilletiaria anomala UBC 951]KDN48179.1 hypothetical protein K437DRAFT_267668 [Tilletiaria anomala UBC 951]
MSVHDSERTPVGLVASSAPTDTASREQLHPSQPDADRCLRAAPDVSADHGDELDAVNFLASFYSWQKRYFSSLASAKSGSLHRREVCPTTTIRHGPESPHFVPLRREMLRILDTYLGPAESEAPKQSHRNEPDRHHASPRLAWMLDLGLIPESTIRAARVAALISMQPDAFGETVQAVVSYLNCHVVPAFFFSKAKNLSKHTERGRLGVGITCTVVAILFSVLLALKPSPLYVGPHSSGTVSRWYRLLLAPLWCAGIGYSMAAWTGICVWLSLRGKREPAEPEIIHRGAEILSVLESGDEDALSERILAEEQDRSARQRWMAPELESLLTRMHLWRARPASQALSSTSRADAFSAASLPTSQPSQLLQFAASGAESLGSTAARQKTEDLSSAASPPTSPIMAPSPPALLLASPSLKSRRIPVLPFEVALIGKPTFFADLGAGAATTALPPSQQAQTHNTPTTSVMSMAGTNPGWMRVAVDVSAMRSAWTRVKQATGFAVHTEPVLDENLRREQQKAALRALCICFLLTVVVLVMTVAVP